MKTVKNIYIICLRELKTYITSPMLYFVLGLFFLLAGYFFVLLLDQFDETCKRASAELLMWRLQTLDINADVLTRQLLNIAFICIFFLPIITMRSIAEEKKNKTIELLMTSPITSMEIVLGKFFAMCGIWLIILILTFMYPLIVANLPLINLDWYYYLSALLGLFLFGLMGISIGLLASSITDNQLIAAVSGFAISAILYFIVNIYNITDSPIGNFAYNISTLTHFLDFSRGIIDTSNIVYFLTGTFFILFVTERVLESQRWR